MKIYIAYKFTAEDPLVLKETLHNISLSLKKANHSVFCSFWKSDFFKENNFTNKQIIEYAIKELDSSDIVLAFVNSDEKSEGMLLELGYALAKKKKIYLAIKKGVKTVFIEELSDTVIEFDDLEELYSKLSTTR